MRRREPERRPLNLPRPLFTQARPRRASTPPRRPSAPRSCGASRRPRTRPGASWDEPLERAAREGRFRVAAEVDGADQVICATGFRRGFRARPAARARSSTSTGWRRRSAGSCSRRTRPCPRSPTRRARSPLAGVHAPVGVPGRRHARRGEVRRAPLPPTGAAMSYTLRGRIESRLAAALAAARRRRWSLARARAATGGRSQLARRSCSASASRSTWRVYHRLLPYQPGWPAVPLGLARARRLTMARRVALGVDGAARAGARCSSSRRGCSAQVLGHAALPLAGLDVRGGRRRARPRRARARAGAVARARSRSRRRRLGDPAADRPPRRRRPPGAARARPRPDARRRAGRGRGGGIVITADDVDRPRPDGRRRRARDRGRRRRRASCSRTSRVSGAALDGIHVRRGQVDDPRLPRSTRPARRTRRASTSRSRFDLAPSLVEGCTVTGGQEGIVTHFAPRRWCATTGSAARAARDHDHRDVDGHGRGQRGRRWRVGVGIFCGDYSHVRDRGEHRLGTRPDRARATAARRVRDRVALRRRRRARRQRRRRGPGGIGVYSRRHDRAPPCARAIAAPRAHGTSGLPRPSVGAAARGMEVRAPRRGRARHPPPRRALRRVRRRASTRSRSCPSGLARREYGLLRRLAAEECPVVDARRHRHRTRATGSTRC